MMSWTGCKTTWYLGEASGKFGKGVWKFEKGVFGGKLGKGEVTWSYVKERSVYKCDEKLCVSGSVGKG